MQLRALSANAQPTQSTFYVMTGLHEHVCICTTECQSPNNMARPCPDHALQVHKVSLSVTKDVCGMG